MGRNPTMVKVVLSRARITPRSNQRNLEVARRKATRLKSAKGTRPKVRAKRPSLLQMKIKKIQTQRMVDSLVKIMLAVRKWR